MVTKPVSFMHTPCVLEHVTSVEDNGDVTLVARLPTQNAFGPHTPRREDWRHSAQRPLAL